MNAASWVITAVIAAVLVAAVLKPTVFKGPRWMREQEKARRQGAQASKPETKEER